MNINRVASILTNNLARGITHFRCAYAQIAIAPTFWISLSMGIFLTGCVDLGSMMSVALPNGPGAGQSIRSSQSVADLDRTSPRKPDSEDIFIPLNFSLGTKTETHLRQHVNEVSESRVGEFVDIGVRAISEAYGIRGTDWRVSIQKLPAFYEDIDMPALEATAQGDTTARIMEHDYTLTAELASPESSDLSLSTASERQREVIMIDQAPSNEYIYKIDFKTRATAELHEYRDNVIYFNIDTHLRNQRKSSFAADKHFAEFDGVNHVQVERLRADLSRILLQAYINSIRSYGLEVQ